MTRSGVEINSVLDALLNPDIGDLIQCNPSDSRTIERLVKKMERVEFELKKEQFDFLLPKIKDFKLNEINIVNGKEVGFPIDYSEIINKVENNNELRNGNIFLDLDTDAYCDFIELIDNMVIHIGMVNQDYLNEDGKKIQKIYDEIYYQTNN